VGVMYCLDGYSCIWNTVTREKMRLNMSKKIDIIFEWPIIYANISHLNLWNRNCSFQTCKFSSISGLISKSSSSPPNGFRRHSATYQPAKNQVELFDIITYVRAHRANIKPRKSKACVDLFDGMKKMHHPF